MLGEMIARDGIKDPRVRDVGLITFTHVKVTGDLRQARVLFIVHGATDKQLSDVRKGLQSASGYMRRLIGEQLRMRFTPTLEFSVDRVFEQEEKVDSILRDISLMPPSVSDEDSAAETEIATADPDRGGAADRKPSE